MNLRSRSLAVFAMLGLLIQFTPVASVQASSVSVTIDGVVQTTIYPGDLIRGTTFSAVYYVGEDGFRYVFPNDKTYFTWYENFDSVKTISDADLATIQMGGNVTYQPGSKMIKINSDPKTYQVSPGGVLRWVTSEDVAVAVYGVTWNTQIDDVPDGFFTNYSIGSAIESIDDLDEAVCFDEGEMCSYTISDDKELSTYSMVMIKDMAFEDISASESVTTISAGQTVMFFNMDDVNHTATADDNAWGTGTLKPGQYFVRRFDTPGTYTYFCSYHPEMTGTVIVEEAMTM